MADPMPSARRGLLRMLLLPREGIGAGTIPEIVVRASGVRADARRLEAFRELVGDLGPGLPLTWPYVMATPLHMAVVGDRRFPLPGFGLVHKRERIERLATIPEDAALDFESRVAGHDEQETGITFDLVTVVRRDGEIVWRSTTTAFKRHPDAARGPSEDDRLPTDGETWDVPEDTGRRYARISRNFDPIHLSAWTARPFGYQRAVVHGMWTVARCVAALKLPSGPAMLDVAFKRPLFLPSRVVFVHEPGDVIPFAVVAPDTGKPYVEGRVAAR